MVLLFFFTVHKNEWKAKPVKKKKKRCLSKNERKVKLCFANREFYDELLNAVKIQDKMEKDQSIYEQ